MSHFLNDIRCSNFYASFGKSGDNDREGPVYDTDASFGSFSK